MYMFADYDAQGPFERAPGYGFRLAKYMRPLPPAVAAPVPIEALVVTPEAAPVGDDIFEVYRRQYAYDRAPLNAVVEATEETEIWRGRPSSVRRRLRRRAHARASLPAAGRIAAVPDGRLLSRGRRIPSAIEPRHVAGWVDFIIRSGRAFLYPVYKGTYERATSDNGTNAERELRIAWSRDLGRAIDYLETRPDIDRTRLAFYGVSAGADAGVILTALEPRLKTSVLQGAGIGRRWAPEMDALNYAPRVRMPTLMLNGRYDFEMPFETAQRPLFDPAGHPGQTARVLEVGHAW